MLKQEKHYWLDWLRFLSAFIVVITHARGFLFVEWGSVDLDSKGILGFIFFTITRLGHEAVLIFFVMSGYFVGGRLILDIRSKTFNSRKYFIDRFTRIYLPFVPALFLSMVLLYLTLNEFFFIDMLGNLIMLQGSFFYVYINNGPLWSLAYEWWFYMAAGLFAMLLVVNNSICRILLFFLMAFSVYIISFLKFQYVISWGLGTIAYIYFRRIKLNFIFVTLFLAICIVVSLLLRGIVGFNYYAIVEVFLSFSFALFISFSSSCTPVSRFSLHFENLGTKLASFSYTLYLIHYPLFYFLSDFLYPVKFESITYVSIFNFLIVVLSAMAFSLFVYYFFERNTQAFRNYFMTKF